MTTDAEKTVLVVDDSPEDVEAVRRFLNDERGWRVREVADGNDVLRECRDARPYCVLLDYELPGKNGLEVLGELCDGNEWPGVPVVMHTGRGDEHVAVRAMKMGADDYIIKGHYTPAQLRKALREAASRCASRAELSRLSAESERRAAALEDELRRKDEFLAMLAHELRNPLAPMLTSLDVMSRPGIQPEQAAFARGVIGRQVRQMARLLDDLLDVSRITRGRFELSRTAVTVDSLVERAVETARPHIDNRGHTLRVHLSPTPVVVEADVARMTQVLANLLNNAAKYTPAGGRIDVTVERDGADAVARVSDTGDGIESAFLGHVFDLFAQADRSLDRSEGGLGIGLTLAKGIVEGHGGRIEAISAGKDRGSTFVVRLPAVDQAPALPAYVERAGDVPHPAGTLRVLVVDDNKDAAESLANLLSVDRHEVAVAFDGPSAVDVARSFAPDLILLDIGLPRLSGYDVCKQIRRDAGAMPTIVAVTGYGGEDDRAASAGAGFDGHYLKPVAPEALDKIVATARAAKAPKRPSPTA